MSTANTFTWFIGECHSFRNVCMGKRVLEFMKGGRLFFILFYDSIQIILNP